ncbi:ABC transporter permease [Gracilibacillus timonensis]|uniref:ABC transporter permease n=1 Tax=Gracilibacillus timonensis TaxID=1816696 RepID=UPI0008268C00|nr:hypothetical protein [Gracilibacillus timonensis]
MRHLQGSHWLFSILLRQHKMRLFYWLAGLTVVIVSVASAYPSMYEDQADREAYGFTMDNPTMVAMLGIGYDDYQIIGSLFAMEMLLFSAVTVAIMNILLMAKATRDDEERGILELVRSRAVGRLSYLHVSLLLMLVTNMLLTVLLTVGIVVLQIDGMDWQGAFLYSSVLGATGILFGSLTAWCAQLVETSKSTITFSLGILFFCYILRAIGDVQFTALSYISPLGWLSRAYVFTDNDWWPVVALLIAAVVLTLITYYLQSIRDIDAGFLPERKGRRTASPILQTTFGFVFHLQRTMIFSWLIGILLIGSAFAAILNELEVFLAENETIQELLTAEGSLIEQFVLLLMAMMAVFITAPVILSILKLRGEEQAQRTELLYSRSLSRLQWYMSYTLLAILIVCIFPVLLAFSIWGIGSLTTDNMMSWQDVFGSAIIYIPALLVVAGITLCLLGWLPKLTSISWILVIYGFIVIYLGDLLDLPKGVKNLSLYEHIPAYPSEDFSLSVCLLFLLISCLLILFGFIGYRQRDMEG